MVKNQSSCEVLGLSPRCHGIVAEGIPQTLVEKNLEKLEAPKRSPLLQELESETKETVSKLKMCSHQFEQITSPPQIRQNLPVQHNSTTTRHASIFGDPLNTALSRCSMVGTPRTPQMTLQSGGELHRRWGHLTPKILDLHYQRWGNEAPNDGDSSCTIGEDSAAKVGNHLVKIWMDSDLDNHLN